MLKSVLFAVAIGLAVAVPEPAPAVSLKARVLFSKFVAEHEKVYESKTEEEYRQRVFAENLKKIDAHNAGNSSYKMKITQFADMTEAEFSSIYLGGYKRLPFTGESGAERSRPAKKRSELPDSVDWRDEGVISDVKNQGSCGSCWAFATTEMIESYAALATNGEAPVLSAQQVTSCTPNPLQCGGTGGCMGSIPQLAYTYIQLFGHTADEDYPYESGSNGSTGDCEYDVSNTVPMVGITGYDSFSNNQEATMTHLAEVGPLAVAVDASSWSFYGSGVFDGCLFTDNIDLNHAVQLVGYGTDDSEGDYWLVRNSWGSSWGDGGYIKLKRTTEMECGTDSTPMDGTACVGGPGSDEQHVCGQCGVLFDMSYPLGAHMK